MSDPTTSRARITHGCRRRIAVIGLARTPEYGLRPASHARLGPVRPRAREAVESIICSRRADRESGAPLHGGRAPDRRPFGGPDRRARTGPRRWTSRPTAEAPAR